MSARAMEIAPIRMTAIETNSSNSTLFPALAFVAPRKLNECIAEQYAI